MSLLSDLRNDLQYGSVLRHQEQQGGDIDGELPPPPPPQPARHTLTDPFIITCVRRETPKLHLKVISHNPEWSGGEVHRAAQRGREYKHVPVIPVVPVVLGPNSTRHAGSFILHTFSSTPPALKTYFSVLLRNTLLRFHHYPVTFLGF